MRPIRTITCFGLVAAGLCSVFLGSLASAAATPEACFAFDAANNRITNYYSNEGNDPLNPPCPRAVELPAAIGGIPVTNVGDSALRAKSLTALTIPDSISATGIFAFANNQLTSVALPPTWTAIMGGVFSRNQLTSITIPASVTSVGQDAFAWNHLTTLTIPRSVSYVGSGAFTNNDLETVTILGTITDLGWRTFQYNKITSVALPDTLTSLGYGVFACNRLQNVTIPRGVASIEQDAFSCQSNLGKDIRTELTSGDTTRKQAAYDSIWYTRLTLEDAANTHNLTSRVNINHYDEPTSAIDYNGDGDTLDVFNLNNGGHLINAAPAILNFVDSSGNQVRPTETYAGKFADGTILATYLVTEGPTFADPNDPVELSAYYKVGDTFAYNAPHINGVVPTPSSYTFTINSAAVGSTANTKVFTYAGAAAEQASPNTELASTGISIYKALFFATGLAIAGLAVAIYQQKPLINRLF